MNLVKWFRKNNTKIMAVVVIVLMIGFIGGSALSYFLRGAGGDKRALAYYGDHKIRYYDGDFARQELDILRRLGVPQLLQRQDVAGILLTELLFPNERGSGSLASATQRAIQQYGYRISDRQLARIYKPSSAVSPEIYWILLRDEAQAAGVYVRPDEAGSILGRMLRPPNGPGYTQAMQSLINQYKVPEAAVLAAFGKLLAIFEYADFICADENMTNAQLRHTASWEGEALDTEFVLFKASDFVDKQMAPAEPNMKAQFEKYKGNFAGEISETNPFGFGYKLPDRIQAEYIAVKLDDVQSVIKKPTQQEVEAYYQQNRQTSFSPQVQKDPNDPNSTVTQVQSYSEVADKILKQLTREKVAAKAEQILTEARSIADANLAGAGSETTGADGNEPSLEKLKKDAGDYGKIAQDLSRKHGVAIYSGRTGLLTAGDVQADKQLSRLRLMSYGSNSIPLSQVLFSVSELGDRAIVLLSAPSAKMFRTIGPLRDISSIAAATTETPNQIMAIARIAAVEKAAEPNSIDVVYSTKTLSLGSVSKEDANNVYSVKEQVLKDLKVLAAWDKTKAKAQEFVDLASKDGWPSAVTKFNDLYGKQLKSDPNDPNVFRVDRRDAVPRLSEAQVEVYTAQLANAPNARSVLIRVQTERRFADQLCSLVPPDANTAPKMPTIMEFKPDQSFYALKTVTIQRLNQQQFQDMKNTVLARNEHVETQSLAMVHFDPENIVKRMKFKYVREGSNRQPASPIMPEDEF